MIKYTRFLALASLICSIFSCQPLTSEPAESVSEVEKMGFLTNETDTIADEPEPILSFPQLNEARQDSIGARYDSLLAAIGVRRKQLAHDWATAPDDVSRSQLLTEAGNYLTLQLTQHILPCWYGTPWDFNGHVNRPHTGEIACGYFVSTPLKHLGFQLNRYKMAQQTATVIVEKLCDRQQRFRHIDTTLDYLRSQPDDLYIVGLDYHVGFLHKAGENIHFIHSSYGQPACVVSEKAEASYILRSSRLYVIGHLASNPKLLKSWLGEKAITIE